jgi:hypothetical protein
VAEVEQSLELSLARARAHELAEGPERRIPLDLVFQQTAPGLRGSEAMPVLPAGEWARHLLVREEPVFFELGMTEVPTNSDTGLLDAQGDGSTVRHVSGSADQADILEGWHQALESPRPAMPGEDPFNGMR